MSMIPQLTVNISPSCRCSCCPEDPPVTLTQKIEVVKSAKTVSAEAIKETYRVLDHRITKISDKDPVVTKAIKEEIKRVFDIDLDKMEKDGQPITLSQVQKIEAVLDRVLRDKESSWRWRWWNSYH